MWWQNHRRKEFERLMLPWMPAAFRLAHGIVRNSDDAADAVQEAYLRAFGAFSQFRGENPRAWLLAIVRNTALQTLRHRGRQANVIPFEATVHAVQAVSMEPSPEAACIDHGELDRVQRAIDGLPAAYREALLLREIEGSAYQEIADVLGVPVGTVMSRLHRAREILRSALNAEEARERRE